MAELSNDEIMANRAKLKAKQSSTATGGKGTSRRKKKASNRPNAAQSDAKLSSALKKLNATVIPSIEEVNFFKEDGKVIHFENPKVQAAIGANTYIISGPNETKPLQELLPQLVNELGVDHLAQLQSLAESAGAGGAMPVSEGDDDDDVPDLVDGNFEEVADK